MSQNKLEGKMRIFGLQVTKVKKKSKDNERVAKLEKQMKEVITSIDKLMKILENGNK